MKKIGPIKALGTVWWIELFESLSETATDEISDLISRRLRIFEATYSRFQPDSLLTQLNTTGRLQNPSSEFVTLLTLGQQYYTQTDGIFNFLTGANQEANGYDASCSFSAQKPVAIANPLNDLRVSASEIILTTGKIDLGGFGKGWLIDDITTMLKAHHIEEFLINGGGDMYGTTEQGKPIAVTLEHPFKPGTYIGSITLEHQALASSSPALRTWNDQSTGKQYSHFIHVQTGETTQEHAAFLCNNLAAEADMLATTLSIQPKARLATHSDCLIINTESTIVQQNNFGLRPL